jgi:hypothetical protein
MTLVSSRIPFFSPLFFQLFRGHRNRTFATDAATALRANEPPAPSLRQKHAREIQRRHERFMAVAILPLNLAVDYQMAARLA